MQAALAEFPHTSLVTPNMANLHRFKAVADMKYSTAVLLLQHSEKKKEKKKNLCMLLLHTFNFENLMIIGSNRTHTPQQEQLPLELRLHL